MYESTRFAYWLDTFGLRACGAIASRSALPDTGVEPRYLMDFWALRCLEEVADADVADTLMDFLFASQDASTASLVWLTTILAERPDILQKVCTCCCSSPLYVLYCIIHVIIIEN